MLTLEQTKELLKGNKEAEEWHFLLIELLPKYNIDTTDRIAGFISQCGHESRNFTVLEENLNYSAEALNKVFPKYFIKAGRDANEYHRQPERIANVIYADRMGNGDESSGDGWRYRGRGVIQLTGYNNYNAFSSAISTNVSGVVKYLSTKRGALESACWYWKTNGINKYADAQDVVMMTKKINGGTIGLEDRKKHYEHALAVLGGHKSFSTVKLGSRGETVERLQKVLELSADGIFGPATESALIKWQTDNGLTPDGIAGPKTLSKLLG